MECSALYYIISNLNIKRGGGGCWVVGTGVGGGCLVAVGLVLVGCDWYQNKLGLSCAMLSTA